jgi:hypothetical protein
MGVLRGATFCFGFLRFISGASGDDWRIRTRPGIRFAVARFPGRRNGFKVKSNVATTITEGPTHACDKRRGRASVDLHKWSVSLAIMASLCVACFACSRAYASDQQVIVEGGQRMAGVVRASGHEVPLLRALEEIVPTNYSVNVPNAGAWADVPVSWRAGTSVVHALGEILSVNPSLQAHVDTDLRLVTVTVHARRLDDDALQPSAAAALEAASRTKTGAGNGLSRPTAATAATAAPAATAATAATAAISANSAAYVPPLLSASSTAASSPSSSVLPTPRLAANPALAASEPSASSAATPTEQTEWQMRTSDGSVRNALARWASEAGWQFVWDVPTDYQVDATATIHGTLEEALRQVANALAGSQVPIQVVLYKRNKVLRVVPKGAS